MSAPISPAPGPLVAELLVDALVPLDVASLNAAFIERGYPLRPDNALTEENGVLVRTMNGGGFQIVSRPETVPPDLLEGPITNAGLWWDEAALVTRHRATIAVAAASRTVPAPSLAQGHAVVTASVIDAVLARGGNVLGVLWNGERLYPAGFVQQHATTNPAIGLLVGFHVADPNPTTSVYTTGLSVLGFKNIEAALTDDVQEAARMVQNMALYLMRHGDVIADGHTVGYSETQHIAVRETESMWGGERVLRLALAAS